MRRTLGLLSVAVTLSLTGCDNDDGVLSQPDLGADMAEAPDLMPEADMKPAPGIKLIDIGVGSSITPDGRYSVMQDFSSGTGDIYVYDSYTDTLTKRGASENPAPAGGGDTPEPQGVFGLSADGSILVGLHGAPLQMAYFASDGWHDLGNGPSVLCNDASTGAGGAWDVSDDGKTI